MPVGKRQDFSKTQDTVFEYLKSCSVEGSFILKGERVDTKVSDNNHGDIDYILL